MLLFKTLQEMQLQSNTWHRQGKTLAFVPTMGYLHEGHLSLIEIAKKEADVVGVSIFVNPTQFGPNEDFEKYPRDEAGDLQKLKSVQTDFVFLPTPTQMYPEGFQSTVHLSQITQGYCGDHRPGHFDGVATVVLKLFHLVKPDIAIFGEKDYQQLALIRQMVLDLNLDIKIIGGPTLRSKEGLALSSRNSYLSDKEKMEALCLSRAIRAIQVSAQAGERKVSHLVTLGKSEIEKSRAVQLEYLEIVDAFSLKRLEEIKAPARILIAVKIGKTRLIDNGPLL
ncbi:MAG: pantoate--beta-alanine ligase [Deltaproteobacteria bacterium]|nr:pantoate--beta-alanine ligase [Deltaproteobacteria bacterium]